MWCTHWSNRALLKNKLLESVTHVLLLADLDSLPPEKQAFFLNCCKTFLLELYRVVKNAEEIIQGCCSQDWLKEAIKLANSTEAFADVIFKLDWCTSVFSIILSDARASMSSEIENVARKVEGFGEEEYERKIEEIHSVLRKQALHDCESLKRRLNELREHTSLAPDRQEIVANLLKLVATHPADGEQSTNKMDLLLTIEPEKLVHISRIGKGAHGVVAKVKWLGQNFAKKSFKCSELRFQQEAEMLASLSHPHIVHVFGLSIDKRISECSLVMELMQEDLNDHINAFMKSPSGASLELPVALDIMLQIAEAMEYLHRKRIVHRDLKATNILINPAKIEEMEKAGYVQAKVADLGESKIKLFSATYSKQSLVGTSRWMAPELFEEKSSDEMRYPFKADVYSYAITCSEILTGKHPYADIEKQSEMREVVQKGIRPTLPGYLPVSVMSLINRCWDADPNVHPSFFQICAELRHIKNVQMISDVVTKLKGALWPASQMEASYTAVEQSLMTMMKIPRRDFNVRNQRIEVLSSRVEIFKKLESDRQKHAERVESLNIEAQIPGIVTQLQEMELEMKMDGAGVGARDRTADGDSSRDVDVAWDRTADGDSSRDRDVAWDRTAVGDSSQAGDVAWDRTGDGDSSGDEQWSLDYW